MRCWRSRSDVKPPVEYRKTDIIWKVKRYLYGDKRATGVVTSLRDNDAELGLRTLGV